ncbi:MAG: DUF3592 domain-containing protein [Aggregatilineales bacterium]
MFVELEGDTVFLLDPRHDAYVTGDAPYLLDGSLSNFQRILIFLLVTICIGLVLTEIINTDDIAITTEAQIITAEEDLTTSPISYFVVYRYQDEDGNNYTDERDIPLNTFRKIEGEDTVQVRYLPLTPFDAELVVGETRFFEQVRGTLILLGLLFILLVYVIVFWLIIPSQRNQRLEREGALLKAKLINAYPTGGNARRHRINVEYHFSTPSGKNIARTTHQIRPDLKDKPLPVMGTAMTVLYVNDRLFKLM